MFVKKPNISEQAEVLFSWLGFVPDPLTIYDEISSFEAGTIGIFDSNRGHIFEQRMHIDNVYFKNICGQLKLDERQQLNEISNALEEAVRFFGRIRRSAYFYLLELIQI